MLQLLVMAVVLAVEMGGLFCRGLLTVETVIVVHGYGGCGGSDYGTWLWWMWWQ